MNRLQRQFAGLVTVSVLLTGCASGPAGPIYVPSDEPRTGQPEPEVSQPVETRPVPKKSEPKPAPTPRESSSSPRYQDSGESLSPAASGLIREADALLAKGDERGAISKLERAQRISPRSSEVYFKLSQAYVAQNNLGAAEQFTLKGLSLTGNNAKLQRSGWSLLADIRRARGNVAGANQAEAKAASL